MEPSASGFNARDHRGAVRGLGRRPCASSRVPSICPGTLARTGGSANLLTRLRQGHRFHSYRIALPRSAHRHDPWSFLCSRGLSLPLAGSHALRRKRAKAFRPGALARCPYGRGGCSTGLPSLSPAPLVHGSRLVATKRRRHDQLRRAGWRISRVGPLSPPAKASAVAFSRPDRLRSPGRVGGGADRLLFDLVRRGGQTVPMGLVRAHRGRAVSSGSALSHRLTLAWSFLTVATPRRDSGTSSGGSSDLVRLRSRLLGSLPSLRSPSARAILTSVLPPVDRAGNRLDPPRRKIPTRSCGNEVSTPM